jgi:hypothetical protein
MHGVLDHARRNGVAWVALFVALGGSSVAAVSLANHSIDPVKLNPNSIGGYTRAWVSVTATGRITVSTAKVRVVAEGGVAPGRDIITWHTRPTTSCAAVGSVDLAGISGQPAPGYVLADAFDSKGRGEQSIVQTYNSQGQAAALPYDMDLVCSTPR